MSVLAPLAPLRAHAGRRLTEGLDDATIARLAVSHPDLQQAIHAAAAEYALVRDDAADLLDLDEEAQIGAVQEGFINFYADDAVTPYVALAARGPWVSRSRARCSTTPAATACSASAIRRRPCSRPWRARR